MRRTFRRVGILLKKRITEMLHFAWKGPKSFDFFGLLFTLAITAAILTIVVAVFKSFSGMYLKIRILGAENIEARKFELLTILFCLVLLVGIISAVAFINYSVFEGEDLKILAGLPFRPIEMVLSKLIEVYIKQVISSSLIILPVCIVFTRTASFYDSFIPLSVAFCFILPVVSIAVAAALSLPVYFVKKFYQSKFILNFIAITVVFGLFFFLYSGFLNLFKQILIHGEIRNFFNITTMMIIEDAVSLMYPAVLFTNIIFGKSVALSIIILVLALLLCLAVSLVLTGFLFDYAVKDRLCGGQRNKYRERIFYKRKTPFVSLIAKEFNHIFRTPSYSFQYLSTALTMPLMVYFCVSIGSSLVKTSLGMDINLELSLFIVALFGVLTNTFCATNISREGPMFFSVKAMPLGVKKIIYSKVVFCMLVAALSNLICAIVLSQTSLIGIFDAVIIFFIGSSLAYAQICFATRKDFNNPHFSEGDGAEIKESNKTVSTVLLTGLFTVFVLGAAILYFSLYLGILKNNDSGKILSVLLCSAVALIFSVLSTLYLNKGLRQKYIESE